MYAQNNVTLTLKKLERRVYYSNHNNIIIKFIKVPKWNNFTFYDCQVMFPPWCLYIWRRSKNVKLCFMYYYIIIWYVSVPHITVAVYNLPIHINVSINEQRQQRTRPIKVWVSMEISTTLKILAFLIVVCTIVFFLHNTYIDNNWPFFTHFFGTRTISYFGTSLKYYLLRWPLNI